LSVQLLDHMNRSNDAKYFSHVEARSRLAVLLHRAILKTDLDLVQ
jgi:hypothetical protein